MPAPISHREMKYAGYTIIIFTASPASFVSLIDDDKVEIRGSRPHLWGKLTDGYRHGHQTTELGDSRIQTS